MTISIDPKPIELNDVEYVNGLFRYRRCEHCGDPALHTYQRETTWAYDWFTACLSCGAKYGYSYDMHREIHDRLLASGWTERGIAALRYGADHLAGGPYSLQFVADEIAVRSAS